MQEQRCRPRRPDDYGQRLCRAQSSEGVSVKSQQQRFSAIGTGARERLDTRYSKPCSACSRARDSTSAVTSNAAAA